MNRMNRKSCAEVGTSATQRRCIKTTLCAKLTRSLRLLVRSTILRNSWIKIVRTHQLGMK